jgi:hypothetical protein
MNTLNTSSKKEFLFPEFLEFVMILFLFMLIVPFLITGIFHYSPISIFRRSDYFYSTIIDNKLFPNLNFR